MFNYQHVIFLLSLSFSFLFVACEDSSDNQLNSMDITGAESSQAEEMEISQNDLSQQLPLVFELSNAEKNRYYETLNGIYLELIEEDIVEQQANTDPTSSCDRCGRETGFLPSPDLFINQFLHVEMKSLTFGLFSWLIDLEEVQEVLSELLGEDSPNIIELSYRLTVVRVDIAEFSPEMITQASEGTLLANESPESVSITSIMTADQDLGMTLEHGYSYLMYVNAIDTMSKLSSFPSDPLMVHCFKSDGIDNGGCIQLNSNLDE